MIYTITLVEKVDNDVKFPTFGDIWRIGYTKTLSEAYSLVSSDKINELRNNFYNYCIIEEMPEGLARYSPNRYIFKYKNNKFVQIDEPIEIHKVTNFCFG